MVEAMSMKVFQIATDVRQYHLVHLDMNDEKIDRDRDSLSSIQTQR
jgi:hypothetical protein